MTLGNRGNAHEFHEFQFHDFSPSNKFKTSILTLRGRFIYLTFANTNKHEQNDEIRHSSFRSSKPHEVKSTDMRCILTTKIKYDEEEKMPDLRLGNVFQLPLKPAYLQKVDSKWDKPCDFFRSPLRAN